MLVVLVATATVADGNVLQETALTVGGRQDPVEMGRQSSGEQCYVVTIFGLKTADCKKQNLRAVPTKLDSDIQVVLKRDLMNSLCR